MNYEEVFNDSLARIRADSNKFMDDFYDIFISYSPEIQDKFKNIDMDRQKTMLFKSFAFITDFLSRKETSTYLDKLSNSHAKAGLGLSPVLYDDWLNALVEAVEKNDDLFSRDIEISWRLVMAPAISLMKFSCSD